MAHASETPLAYRAPAQQPDDDGGPRRDAREEKSGRRRRLEFPPAPEPLPVPVVDNHTHLDFRDGLVRVDVHQAMDAAEALGVVGAVQVGCDVDSARFTIEAIEAEPRLLGAVALHPNDAARLAERGAFEEAFAQIAELARHPRVRAVGETGLDYFRTREEAGHAAQHESFRRHIRLARELGKALQIHDRDAHEDCVAVLEADGAPERTVFHCFSGGAGLAAACAEHGWYASVAGPVTYPANEELRRAVASLPAELLLVETDAPYLPPRPWRGRPNASYLMGVTVRFLARLRGVDEERMCSLLAVSNNTVYGVW